MSPSTQESIGSKWRHDDRSQDLDWVIAGMRKGLIGLAGNAAVTLPAVAPAREPRPLRAPAYELAVVVPTLNEAQNVGRLVEVLEQALAGISWEVIFVDDDSPDRTYAVVRDLGAERPNVRCLRRVGRRGLASAAIEGMLASGAPFLAVMDADLQHEEALLPQMLRILKQERDLDVVVGSRFMKGGSTASLSVKRERLSHFGNRVARWLIEAELSDPLSGFFMLRREVLDDVVRSLSGQGFKILLDLFASAPRPLRHREIPMEFRQRHAGESKLDTRVALEFIAVVADKMFGHIVPVRFCIFVLVGALGVLVHLAVLALLFTVLGLSFYWSQVIATLTAMTSNFYFNNRITFYDLRLRGFKEFTRGLLSFYVACAIGALANFQLASLLFSHGVPWALAGLLGLTVSAVWNYGVTSTFTWKRRRR